MWFPLIHAIKQLTPRRILRHVEYRRIMREARLHIQNGEHQEALNLLLPAVAERPMNVYLRYLVATLQKRLNLPIDLPPIKPPSFRSPGKSVLPEAISKEIQDALAKVNKLQKLDDIDSLKEALRIINALDNKYSYSILGDTPRILRGKIAYALFEKQDYEEALRAQQQIESELMVDPNIVSVNVEKDAKGEYAVYVGVLSLESSQKKNHFMASDSIDVMHKKKTVPIRIRETSIPVALSGISPNILPASPPSSRILENDNNSDKSGHLSEPSPSLASSPLFNETPASLDPHLSDTSSNHFKFGLGAAGVSFFALGLAYYTTSRQAANVTPPDYTRLMDGLTP